MNNRELINCANQSKFYQQKLLHVNTELWESIPFTTKKELREVDEYDLLGVDRSQIATYHETSGTSGKPSPSWFSHNDTLQEAKLLMDSDLQLSENDLILNRFPFAIALPAFILYWTAREAKAGFISADQWNLAAPISRVVEILQKTKPSILAIGSNEAIRLYHVAKAMGVQFPLANLRALIVAGELVSPSRRKYIEQLFGVPVHMLFGSTETGSLSLSCKEGHFHLTHPKVKFEVVDEQGQVLPFNEKGYCVLSTAREGMPLLRYFNEDIIEIQEDHTCSCGNETPVLIHYGREIESITVHGNTFSFYDIQEAIYTLNEIPFQWQLQQIDQTVTFFLQYTKIVDVSSISKELSDKLGLEVLVELSELYPIENYIQKPKHTKTTYIEKIFTDVLVAE
ncbi:phenylacetate--CoA ligase family protein [Ureibacillus sp. FSL E2-3493]|uniref:phenylacetate--CoA ligase family protein n=1 Tax=Ureibacillus sp. FSL E2-3493 TaxID=2921367 RepID=UPI00311A32EA